MTNKKFDLSTLIPEEVHEQAKQAGREAKRRREEVEWHRQNDPNFEEWYTEQKKQVKQRIDAITTDKSIAEIKDSLQKQWEQEENEKNRQKRKRKG